MSSLFASRHAHSDPWSTQPLIGVAAEYSSNPVLVVTQAQSETSAALSVESPVNYDAHDFHFAAIPRLRYSNQSGYSAVTSDYYHLDSSAQFTNALGALNFAGALYRDSSLLYAGGLENGIGVRRDTSLADVNWQRSLTERFQVQFDLSTSRVLFGQSARNTGLVDYRYTSFSPAIAYLVNERDTFRILGGVSRYYSLDGATSSDTDNLQLGYDHKLTELWTVSATAGYAKSNNQIEYFYLGRPLGTVKSTLNTGIYSANLTHQGQSLAVTFGVSRALTPIGLAVLARVDSLNLQLNYTASERWSYGASLVWQAISEPVAGGGSLERHYYNGGVSTIWHWTEQWLVTLSASRVQQTYAQPTLSAASTGVSIQISKQFYRTNN